MLQLKQTLAAVAAATVLSGAAYAQDNEYNLTPDEQTTLDSGKIIFNCVSDFPAIEVTDEMMTDFKGYVSALTGAAPESVLDAAGNTRPEHQNHWESFIEDIILDDCGEKHGLDIDVLENGLDEIVNKHGLGPVLKAFGL